LEPGCGLQDDINKRARRIYKRFSYSRKLLKPKQNGIFDGDKCIFDGVGGQQRGQIVLKRGIERREAK
jgi:hypothetical protein